MGSSWLDIQSCHPAKNSLRVRKDSFVIVRLLDDGRHVVTTVRARRAEAAAAAAS